MAPRGSAAQGMIPGDATGEATLPLSSAEPGLQKSSLYLKKAGKVPRVSNGVLAQQSGKETKPK